MCACPEKSSGSCRGNLDRFKFAFMRFEPIRRRFVPFTVTIRECRPALRAIGLDRGRKPAQRFPFGRKRGQHWQIRGGDGCALSDRAAVKGRLNRTFVGEQDLCSREQPALELNADPVLVDHGDAHWVPEKEKKGERGAGQSSLARWA